MRKRIVTLLTALTMLCSAVAPGMEIQAAQAKADTSGTTYYVSAIHGKDTNSGTSQDAPFYSLQKINYLDLGPGDQVLLECGSVFKNGYLHLFGQNGSADAPIVIDKYGTGADPIIDTNGQGVWFQNYGQRLDNPDHQYQGYVSSSILLYDSEYVEIQNLEIANQNPDIDTVYNAFDMMDRTGVAVVAQDAGTINHIHLKNLNIHDILGNVYNKHMNNGGIYFTMYLPHDAQMTNISGNKGTFVSSATGIPRFDDVLIEGCSVARTDRWGIAVGYTALWDKLSSPALSDEDIKKYGSTNVVIRNNYLKDVGGDAITLMYCDRPLTEYNVSDGAGQHMNPVDYLTGFQRFAAGIWPWKCKDPLFQYNEVFDMQSKYDPDGGNGDGQAWDVDSTDGTIYQYNYSHHNAGGCVMFCMGEACRGTFRYNISQNELKCLINTFGNPKGHIYNNTFYVAEGVPVYNAGKDGGTAVLENNIFYYSGDTPKEENWTVGNKTYRNNLYYNYANTPEDEEKVVVVKGTQVLEDPGNGPSEPAADKRVGAHEDPEMESVFDGYKLSANSPAIGKGKAVEDANGYDPSTVDFFGNDLTEVTTFDIGAHQHQEETDDRPQRPHKPVVGETTATTAAISWTAPEGASGITGYKFKNGDEVLKDLTGTELSAATSGDTISFTLEGLQAETSYTLKFVAYNEAGTESLPQTITFTTKGSQQGDDGPQQPAKPDPDDVVAGDNEATISWAAPESMDGIAGYKVKNGDTVLKTLTSADFAEAIKDGKVTVTVDGLTAGTEYALTIVAYDAVGKESAPQTITIKTTGTKPGGEGPQKPAAPGSDDVVAKDNEATISWAAPESMDGVAGYKVMDGNKVLKELTSADLAAAVKDGKISITVDGLEAGTEYTLTIVAYDAAGKESEPQTIKITTTGIRPGANTEKPSMPAAPSVSGNTQTGATVSWAAAASGEEVTSYKIMNGSATLLNVTNTGARITAKLTGLRAGTTYNLSLIAINKNGNSPARAFTVKTLSAPAPSIRLNQTSLTLYTKGTTSATLTAAKTYFSGAVTWTSSNQAVATVLNGKVTAKKAGTAVITATAGSAKATCAVTVKIPTIKVKKSVSVKKGKKVKLKVTATPTGKITYKSSKKKIATVTKKGVIKGVKKGSCNITVKCNGVTKKVKVKVK